MSNPNIIRTRGCRVECSHTWRYDHGPDRSLPGTFADEGDVRRCEHGSLWVATGRAYENLFHCKFDEWDRLRKWATPIRYRKAVAALEAGESGE